MKYLLLTCLFALLSATVAAYEDVQKFDVKVGIELQCPMSQELQNFMDTIPTGEDYDENDWDSWSHDFVLSMRKLIELVESGKVGNAVYSTSVIDQDFTNQQ